MPDDPRKTTSEISEQFLLGDLLKLLMGEIKQLDAPFASLPEKRQKQIAERVQERAKAGVEEVVRIVAGKGRPVVRASIESVLFKDGVKVTLTFGRQQADRHAIADAAGAGVLLVLPQYELALEGGGAKDDKAQPALV